MSNADRVAYPLTIYYDASCPVCATEMNAIKAHDPQHRLTLVDCSADPMADGAPAQAGIPRAVLMQAIHARDANGVWLRGDEVFAAAYGAAGLNAMARLWSHPRLRPLWEALYPWIARNRQPLSRLGAPRVIGRLIAIASRRQVVRMPCSDSVCASK
jgi:predicted DCC family thiol-disulfide oxidoreductase YuxK